MRFHRIYYPFTGKDNQSIRIMGDKAHYIQHVLRLKTADKIRIFNHLGQEYLAEISTTSKTELVLIPIEKLATIAASKLNITIVQSISKGERMDYTVQKATELGVASILPISSEFCEVKLSGTRLEKKLTHWQNICISACEQSFRADIPTILTPMTLVEYCKQSKQGILLEPSARQNIQSIAALNWQKFDVVIGPEGGWSATDLSQLQACGLEGVHFGQRILRTETVAPAILAAIHSLWGDFI